MLKVADYELIRRKVAGELDRELQADKRPEAILAPQPPSSGIGSRHCEAIRLGEFTLGIPVGMGQVLVSLN